MSSLRFWHFGPSDSLDHVLIYSFGGMFDEKLAVAEIPASITGAHDICAAICNAHNATIGVGVMEKLLYLKAGFVEQPDGSFSYQKKKHAAGK